MTSPRNSRRWLSFRLRTLLILIAVVAVPLAWIANERRQSLHEQQIAELLEGNGLYVELGSAYFANRIPSEDEESDVEPSVWLQGLTSKLLGKRIYGISNAPGKDWNELQLLVGLSRLVWLSLHAEGLVDLTPLAQLTTLRRLDILGANVRDLSPLSGLTELRMLELYRAETSDLSPLAGLSKLKILRLEAVSVSDLTPLAGLVNLQELTLTETLVSDLRPLTGLKQLRTLELHGTRVRDLSPIAALDQLQTLRLGTSAIDDLAPLVGLPLLEEVSLGRSRVDDLSPLNRMKQLKTLYLYNSRVTKEQFELLQQALPNLKIDHDHYRDGNGRDSDLNVRQTTD